MLIASGCGRTPAVVPAVQRAAPSAPTVPLSAPSRLSQADVSLWARLLAASDSRRLDVQMLDSMLRASHPRLRAAGALAAGQVGVRAFIPRLRERLGDADTAIAAAAAFSLALLHDSGGVPALDRALDGPLPVALEVAWALGEIGAPARPTIESALAVGGAPAPVIAELLLAAAKLRPLPVARITPYLSHGDTTVVWAAAYALARQRPPSAVRPLLGRLRWPTAAIRAQVARAFAKSAAGDSLGGDARVRLDILASDPHPHVRINALRSYATYGAPARLAVLAAARDRDPNVRIAAAQTLGAVMDRDLARWIWLWDADTTLAYRAAVLAGAAAVGVRHPGALEWGSNPDWRHRAAVAEAAGTMPTVERRGHAGLAFLHDSDSRVRAAALRALASALDSASGLEWRPRFVERLEDPDPYVRAAALAALGRRATAADVPSFIAAYQRALADSVDEARVGAIGAIVAAWRADSARFTAPVRASVRAISPSSEPLVRRAARQASLFSHWPGTEGTAREIGWYERIVRAWIAPALEALVVRADIVSARGTIAVELFPLDAPLTVDNFVSLARRGFYRGGRFHRVVPNFVAQDGDPRGDGTGGPGWAIRDELNRRHYGRGVLGMALSGPDTGGSQWFLTHSAQPHLDGHYTVFGRVIGGFDALDAIVQGDPLLDVRVR